MDWAERYRPLHLQDIVGNPAVIRQMAVWAKEWTRKSRPLLLYGKPGIGKTSSVFALANDMGWEVVELNASDQRTAAVIERIAGEGSTTGSLTGASRKLIVLDEADNLQGTADRGGAKAILTCIRESLQPMVLIANDLYGIPAEIRLRCEPLQFKAIPARSIAPRLKYICATEKVSCSESAVRQIAESAEGDMRSAVNMLFASSVGRTGITDAQVQASRKDERISIFTLLAALAGAKSDEELMRLSWEIEDVPETVGQWIEGNIALLVPKEHAGTAYRHLARADEYLGYTYRRQYHTLWRYATALMLLGVADAAGGRGISARIMPPARWQKMAGAKKQKAIRTSVLSRFAGMMHIPATTLREEYLSTMTLLVESDPAGFAEELVLDADQLNFFLADKSRASSIVQEVTRAARDREKGREKQENGEKLKTQGKREKVAKDSKDPGAPGAALPPQPASVPETLEKNAPGKTADTTPPGPEKKPAAKTQSTLFDGF